MRQRYFDLEAYAWGVIVCYDIGVEDLPDLEHALEAFGAPTGTRRKALSVIRTKNSGFTYTDEANRMSLVAIGPATDAPELFDSLLHEVKHLVEHVSSYYGVNPKGEPAAYLQGEVGRKLKRAANGLVCPECGAKV